jgi:hypothetical protein
LRGLEARMAQRIPESLIGAARSDPKKPSSTWMVARKRTFADPVRRPCEETGQKTAVTDGGPMDCLYRARSILKDDW